MDLCIKVLTWALCAVLGGLWAWSSPVEAAVDILTSRNDAARTGANIQETILTTTNVSSERFGWLFAYGVEGNIYGQPLVVNGIRTALGIRNVVYIVTTNNVVYAFDADSNAANGGLIWTRRFVNPRTTLRAGLTEIPYDDELVIPVPSGMSTRIGPIAFDDSTHFYKGTTFQGNIGIVGTPVISLSRRTMYFVARTKENSEYVQTLHALSIDDGSERPGSPRQIARDSNPASFAAVQNQRAGLALSNDKYLFIAWGSPGGRENNGSFNGYIMTFDASTLERVSCFTTATENIRGTGIWQAGRAPVIGTNGDAYFFTGNGWDKKDKEPSQQAKDTPSNMCGKPFSGGGDYRNSLIALDVAGRLRQHVPVVAEPDLLNYCDLDLGGSGPLLVPGTTMLIGGGKQGFLHVFDVGPHGKYAEIQESIKLYDGATERLSECHAAGTAHQGKHHVMSGPVYWSSASKGPLIYVTTENGKIRAYPLTITGRRVNPQAISETQRVFVKHPGAILSLSANGGKAGTGILWAVHADRTESTPGNEFTHKVKGVLRAYDAEDLSRELWNSNMVWRDALGDFAKFTPVTVANGKVYVPTFSGKLLVYGLREH